MRTINIITLLLFTSFTFAQVGTNGSDRKEEGRTIREYNLTIEENKMTLGGVSAKAMTINGSIPGPVLEFDEGDLAIINVTNKMDEETSVHWHGLLLFIHKKKPWNTIKIWSWCYPIGPMKNQ